MSKLRISSLYLITVLAIWGCFPNRINKYYEFSVPESLSQKSDIVCRARLLGKFTEGKRQGRYNVTIKGNPYELFISLRSSVHSLKSASINSLRFFNESKKEIKIPGFIPNTPSDFEYGEKEVSAYFSFYELMLSYQSHTLVLEIDVLSESGRTAQERFVLEFEPQYKEDKSNDTWDRLMSV